MNIAEYLKVYLVSTVIFFALDMVWLTAVAKNLYREQLGTLLAKNINWPAAITFYLLFIVGITIFAISPSIEGNSSLTALVYGALFGFFTYATFDLTNLATIQNWPVKLTFIDLAWGTILSASVATGTFLIYSRWLA